MIPVEEAVFATDVATQIVNEIDRIIASPPDLPIEPTNNFVFLIVQVIKILDSNFAWVCVQPPGAPDKFSVCSNSKLLLG